MCVSVCLFVVITYGILGLRLFNPTIVRRWWILNACILCPNSSFQPKNVLSISNIFHINFFCKEYFFCEGKLKIFSEYFWNILLFKIKSLKQSNYFDTQMWYFLTHPSPPPQNKTILLENLANFSSLKKREIGHRLEVKFLPNPKIKGTTQIGFTIACRRRLYLVG